MAPTKQEKLKTIFALGYFHLLWKTSNQYQIYWEIKTNNGWVYNLEIFFLIEVINYTPDKY